MASRQGWKIQMGPKSPSSRDSAPEDSPKITENNSERRQTVGYGYRDQKSARGQLWSKYKGQGLTEGKFGGGDPLPKQFTRAWGDKDMLGFIKALFPPITWLEGYTISTLAADVTAGVIVGCSSVPLGFAHALIAGVTPEVGLWTCFVPCLVYAALASSKHLAHGTDATIALMTHDVLSKYPEEEAGAVGQCLALMVGLILLCMGLLRIDYIIHYISRPILSGFLSGSTVLVILSQFKYLVGSDYESSVFGAVNFIRFWKHVDSGRWITCVASLIILPILILAAFFKGKLLENPAPSKRKTVLVAVLTTMPLIVACLATIISYVIWESTSSESSRLNIIGETFGLPSAGIDAVSSSTNALISDMAPQALIIALMSYISSMSMALSYSTGKYEVSGMQELLAMGTASLLGACFGAMPPSSGLSRTAISTTAGQETQVTSGVAFGVLLIVLVAMQHSFYYMPFCVLACIVVVSSAALFDWRTPLWLYRIGAREDLYAYLFALGVTVFLGPTYGMFLSLGLSLVLIIQRISLPRMTVLGKRDGRYEALERDEAALLDGVVVINVVDSLFFGNSGRFKDQINEIVTDGRHVGRAVRVVVLDLESVLAVDSTGLTTLQELNLLLAQQKVVLLLAGLQSQVFKFIALAGIASEFKQTLHLNTPVDAIVAFAQELVSQIAAEEEHPEQVELPVTAKTVEPNPVGIPADPDAKEPKSDLVPSSKPDNQERL